MVQSVNRRRRTGSTPRQFDKKPECAFTRFLDSGIFEPLGYGIRWPFKRKIKGLPASSIVNLDLT